MSYVDKTLVTNEEVIYRSRLHWSLWWGPLSIGILITLVSAGLALLVVIPWWLFTFMQWRASEFAVTNRRISLKTGVLQRRALELILNRVETVSVDQGVVARMSNYGTVTIIGTGGSREQFHGLARPMEFRAAVMDQLSRLT